MPSTRILLVDDEVSVLELIRTTLETCGYVIDTAASSQEAMEKVRHNEYGMVILDLLLPDMNGFVLSQEISRIRPRLKERILFISAVLFGQNTVDHLNAMGAGFLPKPFETTSLVDAVNRISGSPQHTA